MGKKEKKESKEKKKRKAKHSKHKTKSKHKHRSSGSSSSSPSSSSSSSGDDRRARKRLKKEAKAYLLSHAASLLDQNRGGDAAAQASGRPEPIAATTHAMLRMNAPFSAWVQSEVGKPLELLSQEEKSRKFADFVQFYNSGRLEPLYYRLASEATAGGTEARTGGGAGGALSAAELLEKRAIEREEQFNNERQARKRLRDQQQDTLGELLGPKPTGFEAKVEQRNVRREAQAARGESPDLLPGGYDPLGEQPGSFAAIRRAEEDRSARSGLFRSLRDDQRNQKLAEARTKEEAQVEALKRMAGLM